MRSARFFAAIAIVVVFSGCKNQVLDRILGRSETESPSAASGSQGRPSPSASEAVLSNANAEILNELFHVVLLKEPQDRSEFGSYVDSMNQGASVEGLYNGFTHSAEYRGLEQSNPGASPVALQAFAEELALLELELPAPTRFGADAARPLATPVEPTADAASASNHADGLEKGEQKPSSLDPLALANGYLRQFAGASIFTLKRVLGDEALKLLESKRSSREKLATWYSKWVARISRRRVDFGVALRSKPDEKFHYSWAMKASDDRITWEVLNRLHRVLNEASRPASK